MWLGDDEERDRASSDALLKDLENTIASEFFAEDESIPMYWFLERRCQDDVTADAEFANTCNGPAKGPAKASLPFLMPVHKVASDALADKVHMSASRHCDDSPKFGTFITTVDRG